MALLTNDQKVEFLTLHPRWSLEGESLRRTFVFGDFVEAMGFVTQVALLAEKAFHHPDIDIRWNRVSIELTTHDDGGLSEKDTALAAAIDDLLTRSTRDA